MTTATDCIHLQPDQIEAAALALHRAFFDDPLFVYVLPDEDERERGMPALFRSVTDYGHRYGEVYTTPTAVEGAAIWQPPAVREITPEQIAASGMDRAMIALGEQAGARFMNALQHFGALRERDAAFPHWYLMVLGVDPPRQGIGVGGRLIAPVLRRADEAGMPCYLETLKTRNLPFYRKHGFEVVAEGDVPAGGPHYWTMLRRPRSQ